MRRPALLALALLVVLAPAGSAAEPPFREILYHAAAHERRAVMRLHDEEPNAEHEAAEDLRAALRSLKWARRLAGEQLPPPAARAVRHRLDDAAGGDRSAIAALERGRPRTALLLIERALGEKETAAVMAAGEKKEGSPVPVAPPVCRQSSARTAALACSVTHFWDFNVPRKARAPQCHLVNAATGRGLGVVFPGMAERRTCKRRSPTVVRLTLVLTSDAAAGPRPKRVRAIVSWR